MDRWYLDRVSRLVRGRLRVVGPLLACGAGTLAAQRPAVLDTVSVVASRTHGSGAAAARSVTVITRDEIARTSARTVADVLSTVMGVDLYTRSPAQADVSIRGSSAEQIVVVVDGVRMSDVQSAHYTLDLGVPLASVERIEVMRGLGSALYGPDAVGGVINIVTSRAPADVARAHSGSFGTVGGALAGGTSRDATSLGVSADFDKSDGHRDGTDYRMGQGRVSYTTPAAGGALRANAALGVRDFGAADFYAPYNSIERTTTTTLDSRWDRPVGAWSLALSGSTRRHQDHYVLVRGDPSIYENRHESWQTTGDAVATSGDGPVGVALGVEGVHDQLSSARLGGRRDGRAGAFAELSAGHRDGVAADAGLRADHSSVYGDFVSPSLSASAHLSDAVTIHASGGGGFRAPTWTERFYTDPSNQGNPDLRPERFWTAEAGARASAGPSAFDVTGFVRRATDLIDWVKPEGAPATAVWQATNVGEATYRGIEAALELPAFGGVSTTLFADGLTLDASESAGIVGKYALRPITRQAGARWSTPATHALAAHVDLIAAQRAKESGYATANVRVSWTRGDYRLTLDATNLANADWLDASGKPVAGRGLYGGIEWRR